MDINRFNIYYRVSVKKPYRFQTTEKRFDFPAKTDGAQCFSWIKINELSENDFTFPTDKHIVLKIKKDFNNSV